MSILPVERISVPDSVLVGAATAGDRTAFTELVRRYQGPLLRYAEKALRDPQDAAEIVQDTLVAAWRQLPLFRLESSVSTWLYAICSHKVIDAHRRRRSTRLDTEWRELPTNAGDPFTAVVYNELNVDLGRALQELPVLQRASWVLREIHAKTYPDIGLTLSMTAGAVRGQHNRAASALALRLQHWQSPPRRQRPLELSPASATGPGIATIDDRRKGFQS